MREVKLYECTWQQIDQKDWPEVGQIYVTQDSHKRLGDITWVVARMGDGTLEGDTIQLGLFWELPLALFCARCFAAMEGGGAIDIDGEVKKQNG